MFDALDIDYVEPAGSLYAEGGARYVSAQFTCDLDGSMALGRVTCILTAKSIITVRYESLTPSIYFRGDLPILTRETSSPQRYSRA